MKPHCSESQFLARSHSLLTFIIVTLIAIFNPLMSYGLNQITIGKADQNLSLSLPSIESMQFINQNHSPYLNPSLYLIPSQTQLAAVYLPENEIQTNNKLFSQYILISYFENETPYKSKQVWWRATESEIFSKYRNLLIQQNMNTQSPLPILERIPISESGAFDDVSFIEFIKYTTQDRKDIILNKIIKNTFLFIKGRTIHLIVASNYTGETDLRWVEFVTEATKKNILELNGEASSSKIELPQFSKGSRDLKPKNIYLFLLLLLTIPIVYFLIGSSKVTENSENKTSLKPAPPMPIEKILFSFHGRISSMDYLKGLIISIPLSGVLALICFGFVRYIGALPSLFLYFIATGLIVIIISVKRLRDANHSPWYALIMLIPGLQAFLLWYLLAAPSREGAFSRQADIVSNSQKSPSIPLTAEQLKARRCLFYYMIGISIFMLIEPLFFLTLKFIYTLFFDFKNTLVAFGAIALGVFPLCLYVAEHFLKIIVICLVFILFGWFVWQAGYVSKNYKLAINSLKKLVLLYIPTYIFYTLIQGSIVFNLGKGNPFDLQLGGQKVKPLTLTSPY